MLQRKYKAKVEEIINPLPDIYTVTFSSEKRFQYKPGQFLHLTLDEFDGTGQWPESRCFSMQSSPDEELLKITFSVKGKYTKRMADELKVGNEVWLKLPYGDIFEKGHSKENCVFIAGGTGITPFLSLFIDASFSSYTNPKLYFGIRSKEFDIFEKELDKVKGVNYSFKLEKFFQDVDGFIDIKKVFEENGNTVYFLSGPPVMITNFKNSLTGLGIKPDNVKTDDWE